MTLSLDPCNQGDCNKYFLYFATIIFFVFRLKFVRQYEVLLLNLSVFDSLCDSLFYFHEVLLSLSKFTKRVLTEHLKAL